MTDREEYDALKSLLQKSECIQECVDCPTRQACIKGEDASPVKRLLALHGEMVAREIYKAQGSYTSTCKLSEKTMLDIARKVGNE